MFLLPRVAFGDAAQSNVSVSTDANATVATGIDLVVEAIKEDIDLKQKVVSFFG